MPREISLTELADLLAEGPAGREKLEKQRQAIQNLQESLNLIARRARPYEVPVEDENNTITFGIISDTHIGSLYQRVDALSAFYRHCERRGVRIVLHAGDVLDGWKVYRGQEFELHPGARSWPEQRDMFAELMPKIKGIETYFITGNHDRSFKNMIGLVVGEELQKVRPDWHFVGQDVGFITLRTGSGKKFLIELLHPGGGVKPYAVSYSLQKIIDAIPGGQKPDLLAAGHFHKAFYMPAYRNVQSILAGTFQSQTPFMAQHSLAANVGGWIVSVVLGERKKLTSRVQAEFIGFYEEQR